jgi:hypothetical protein
MRVTGGTVRPRLPGSDSLWLLAAVAGAFSLSQLLVVPPHLGLSWDEVVYVSQTSSHAPAAFFDPARSRGVALLVAPVAFLTGSVAALRVYLAVASGLALFGSLAVWRKWRPAWVLALAGLMFAGLWVARFYGPQALPDEWLAFTALAATGLFANQPAADRWRLAVLAALIATAVLIRPGDAVFLAGALLIAAATVPAWRSWPVVVAISVGFAAGCGEWIIEAYLRFGGPLQRLHLASAEQGGLGLHLGWWAELRAVNGPTLCRPCTVGWRYPVLSVWWLALPVLVTLGVLVTRRPSARDRFASSALTAGCAFALAAQYLFGVDYAAPRFLLPAYALAAIPIADLAAWLLTESSPRWRAEVTTAVVVLLIAQIAVQQVVLAHEVAGTARFHAEYATAAADLGRLGIRPPCLLNGSQRIPIAFYAGCASTPESPGRLPPRAAASERFAVLAWPHQRPPAFARTWRHVVLAGTAPRPILAYLPPA